MNADTVIAALQSIAPLEYAAEWDNVGLLVGSRDWPANRIFLTIDLTTSVFEEAKTQRADFIVAYHPPIFHAVKSFTDASPMQRIVLEAARSGIAIYSPHTALDAAPGGLNDWLVDGVGQGEVTVIEAQSTRPESEQFKIVTFCPANSADVIRSAMSASGAGRIGAYEQCSFEIPGTGTFHAGEHANPTVGEKGSLQRVNEVRLEMVCSESALTEAIGALKQSHPYEEPPIEIYKLHPRPSQSIGLGRLKTLTQPTQLATVAERMKKHLSIDQVKIAEPKGVKDVHRVAVCAGAGGSLLNEAIHMGADAFLTGEMRHHDVLAAVEQGCAILLAGHTNTERGYLPTLKEKTKTHLPGAHITISSQDVYPLHVA